MTVRVGVMLPTFTADPTLLQEAAAVAETGGLAGVFAFDHLWPMGSPGRPALWSFGVLAAVAAATPRLALGPLVARIDLLPEDELVRTFATLAAIAGPDRVIAALGAGDSLSGAENLAYGLPHRPAAERLEMVARVADRVRALGIVTWVGGTSDRSASVAAAHADAHNLWGVPVEQVAKAGGGDGHVPQRTWGGQVLIGRDTAELDELKARFGERDGLVVGTVPEVADHLRALESSGATWCVCAPLDYIAQPARAVETVCLVAKEVQ